MDNTTGFLLDKSNFFTQGVFNIDPTQMITTSAVQPPTQQFLLQDNQVMWFDSFNLNVISGAQPLCVFDCYSKSLVNQGNFTVKYFMEGQYQLNG